jgi:hypothetical protein
MSKINDAQTNPAPETDVMDIQATMDRVRAGCKETIANCDRLLASSHDPQEPSQRQQPHPSDD